MPWREEKPKASAASMGSFGGFASLGGEKKKKKKDKDKEKCEKIRGKGKGEESGLIDERGAL